MYATVAVLLLTATGVAVPKSDAADLARERAAVFWGLEWATGPIRVVIPDGPPRRTKALTALGDSLYRERCASCHGEKGEGDGPEAVRLRIRPTNFTNALYKLRSTPFPFLPTDADLFATLTRGIHGTAMLPWRHTIERERWALVAKLKSFSPRFARERPGTPIPIPAEPAETDDLKQRGKRLYSLMECATCHGDAGAGDGPIGKDTRQWGAGGVNPVRDFTRGRFIRGTAMADLYLTLQTGLDGTMMGSYNALLSDEEIWAVAAYVRSLVREHPLDKFPPARTQGTQAGALRRRVGDRSRGATDAGPPTSR